MDGDEKFRFFYDIMIKMNYSEKSAGTFEWESVEKLFNGENSEQLSNLNKNYFFIAHKKIS